MSNYDKRLSNNTDNVCKALNALSKEFIDYYKEKWKKYRITKKQMEMAYKLLMK